jgi:hypothetical protein
VIPALGALLVYFAAIFAVLATSMTTCTMGAADSLLVGAIFSVPLYFLGFDLLILRPMQKAGWFSMVPALFAIAYQTFWTIRFFIAYSFFSTPVCDLITGYGPFNYDGREKEFIAIWMGMSALSIVGMVWAWIRTSRYTPVRSR